MNLIFSTPQMVLIMAALFLKMVSSFCSAQIKWEDSTATGLIAGSFIRSCYPSDKISETDTGEIKYKAVKVNVQWAYKVTGFSSQYSNTVKAAHQILGKPNVLPTGGSSPCAWASKAGMLGTGKLAFIRVAFEKPVKAQQVAVAVNFNPGAVEKIILYGARNEEKVIYQNTASKSLAKPGILNVFFEQLPFEVTEGALFLNPGVVPGCEIDAFGISASHDTVKAEINIIRTVQYSFQKENLGKYINTKSDEAGPVVSPGGKELYFVRKFAPENMGGSKDEDDIWYSQQVKDGNWSLAVNLGSPLNTKENNFVQSVSFDGKSLLLGNVYSKKGQMLPGCSLTHKTNDGWSVPLAQEIDSFINLNQYVNYYLSGCGKFLLMAVETDSSNGGLDLYVSFKTGENHWSKPKNIGRQINTAANDFSPFLAADGITLYYSTSGWSGYGKEDFFMSRRFDDTWTNWSEPLNLGPVVNTAGSDTKYSVPASGEFAYFTSTANSLGLHDIFRIKLPEIVKLKPVVLVKGTVWNDKNNQPVSAEIIYETLPDGKEVGRARTDPNTGEYTIVLPAGYNYSFRAIADDFIGVAQNLNLTEVTEYAEFEQRSLRLAPIEIGTIVTLNNIFFDYANANLKPESFSELNRVAEFLKSNSGIKIEIGGHTDNSGSDATNDKLSKNRAQAVTDYLINSGIDASRITAVGYGKNRTVADNSTEEGKAKNRRVEFTIIKK